MSAHSKDVEGFLALFRPDALWTTAHGKVLLGLDAIAAFTPAVQGDGRWLPHACQNTQVHAG